MSRTVIIGAVYGAVLGGALVATGTTWRGWQFWLALTVGVVGAHLVINTLSYRRRVGRPGERMATATMTYPTNPNRVRARDAWPWDAGDILNSVWPDDVPDDDSLHHRLLWSRVMPPLRKGDSVTFTDTITLS